MLSVPLVSLWTAGIIGAALPVTPAAAGVSASQAVPLVIRLTVGMGIVVRQTVTAVVAVVVAQPRHRLVALRSGNVTPTNKLL